MSKIGKRPIKIPAGVTVSAAGDSLLVRGRLGEIRLEILPYIKADLRSAADVRELAFSVQEQTPSINSGQARANWGTMAALARNAIGGVNQGFSKVLELEGIGYRAAMEGDILILNIGFSHPVKFKAAPGVKISVEKNRITVSGQDKFLVGETAANIRKIRKPEPYKGKGIHYLGEVIRRKAGKKAGSEGVAAK